MTWFNLMKEKGCEKLLEECSGENAVLKQRLIMVFDAWELNERSPSDYTKKELDRVMKLVEKESLNRRTQWLGTATPRQIEILGEGNVLEGTGSDLE